MLLSVDISTIRAAVGDFAALDMIKAAGFDAIDYHFHNTPYAVDDGYLDFAKKIREHLDKIGLICNQAHAPFPAALYGETYDISNPRYLAVIRSIEAAKIMGAKNIIVHGVVLPEDVNGISDTHLESNYKFYKSLEPWAKKFDIKISIENLFTYDEITGYHNGIFEKPYEMSELIEHLDSDVFNVCLDVGHAFISGTKPANFVRGMKPGYLKALHIQECTDGIGDKHQLPYLGFIDWEDLAKALKEYHYDGDFTFEILRFFSCFPDDCLPEALKLAEKVGRHIIKLIEE